MEISAWIAEYGLLAIPVLLVAAGTGLMNQDLVLFVAGWMSAAAGDPLWLVTAVAFPSILLCDQILYSIMRGARRFQVVREGIVGRFAARIAARGMLAVFVVRFLTGTRGAMYAMVGLGGLSRARFLLADAAGAVISVPLWIWLGRRYGPGMWKAIEPYAIWVLVGVVAVVLIAVVVKWVRTGAALELAEPRP